MLERISLPPRIQDRVLDSTTESFLIRCERAIGRFQDNWDVHRIEQYVAADFRAVIRVLRWVQETRQSANGRFLEWGCGFGVVAAQASVDGWDAIGIESESVLITQARQLAEDHDLTVELVEGNFLPAGAESLSDDPCHPSLNHPETPAYEAIGLDLDDFGVIYSYPWPGENLFHETVVERYAAAGTIHIQFAGPNDVRVFVKTDGTR